MKEIKFKIFVVFHQDLNKNYYQEDLLDNYVFINVNPNNDFSSFDSRYNIVNLFEMDEFHQLGKWYTESEVIYNIYKNAIFYEELDFVGFSQYDIDTSKLTKQVVLNMVSEVEHINFQPHSFKIDYDRKVIMDERYPNRPNGKGVNCYNIILKEYNIFYDTSYQLSDLQDKTLNLCSAFILKRDLFKKMMEFVSPVIESRRLDKFDTKRKYRIQGGYLERYYALWIALENKPSEIIELDHHFIESVRNITLVSRVLDKVRKWV